MTCPETESNELLGGYIVALSRGSQLRVRLEDGREIRAIPLLEAWQEAACPGALIFNRPVRAVLAPRRRWISSWCRWTNCVPRARDKALSTRR